MGEVRRVPHCSHWGAYTLLVEDGRIIGAEPFEHDPSPSPIIGSVSEWAKTEMRVLRPMVRKGWLDNPGASDGRERGRDKFVSVGWDEVLDLIAGEIDRVRRDFGNESIFAGSYGWTSCGRFHHASTLLKRMLNLVGGFTGHVDTYSAAAGPAIMRHVVGSDNVCYGFGSTLDTVAAHSDTLLVFGGMSPRTAQNEAGGVGPHLLETSLRAMVDRNVRIVHISPLRDDIPDWVGAEWWPIRPNTDAALMLGLAGEIVLAGRHDTDFLERCCSGSDRLIAYLDGTADGIRKDAGWAAAITGLDAAAIAALAVRLVETRSMLAVSWSLQRAQHGEQPYWAALSLAAIAGQIGLPGGGVGYAYGSVAGIGSPIGIGKSPSVPQLRRVIDSFIPVSRIADMLLNPGGTYTFEGKTRVYPDARLVYWAGGNPYHHHQDLNRLEEAWSRPETIIVQDPMWTATAQRADIVLPVSTSLERNDIAGNKRTNYVFAMHKAIEPLGEARSDFEIFDAIAAKLGVAEGFNEGRDEMGWIRHMYEESRTNAIEKLNFEMDDFETFWQRGYALVPTMDNHTYLADYRAAPEDHALPTESGRIVLGSETLAALDYADCPPHAAWIPPGEWLGSRQDDDELHLISNQPAGRLHSQLERGPASMAGKVGGREMARLHPDEAASRNIADGTTIRLWNERGAVLSVARLDSAVSRGVVVLPTGAWFTPANNSGLEIAGNPNVLTKDIPSSSFGQGCAAHTCLVRVEPYAGENRDAQSHYSERLASLIA